MLTLWFAVSSAAALPPPPSFDIVPVTTQRRIQELCFPSGLHVTVVQDDRAPVVGVTAVVGRGSAADSPDKAGASHLLEHLWFRARPDGKASVNDRLLQFQADILGVPVVRPVVAETTALGAAYAAGLAVGFWRDADEMRSNWQADKQWEPRWSEDQRAAGYVGWQKAIERTLNWVDLENS